MTGLPPTASESVKMAAAAAGHAEHPEQTGQPAASLVIRPGDKLVLGFPDKLPPSLVDRIQARSAERLPGVEVVVFDGVSHLAVYRAGES